MTFLLSHLPKGPAFGPANDDVCRPYDMPYAPFNSQDKLGRVADWLSQDDPAHHYHHHQQRGAQNQRTGRVSNRIDRGGDVNDSAFGFKQEYDEATFATVDATGRTAAVVVPTPSVLAARGALSARGGSFGSGNRSGTSTRGGSNIGRPGQSGGSSNRFGGNVYQSGRSNLPQRSNHGSGNGPSNYRHSMGGYRGGNQFQQRTVVRESSLKVNEDWAVVGELDLPRINKHGAMDEVPQADVLEMYGSVAMYAKQYDRVTTKNEQPLQVSDRSNIKSINPSTLEDPVMVNLITDAQGSATVPTIFATDSILSQIMASPRAVYSWDLVVTRLGDNVVVLDKRPGVLDLTSVNENAQEPPQDHPTDKEFVNNPGNLAIEATYIGANYSQQVLDHTKRVTLGQEVPIHESVHEDEKPSAAYIYKKWHFGEHMDVVVRTEIDAVLDVQGKSMMATIRALNQAPGLPGTTLDWRKSLDAQRGAVMAMEMRNNGCKLTRWIMQALLAETELMKLGFVARASPRDVTRHTILGVATYKPSEFATQMNVSMTHGFGIVYAVAEAALQQPPGKYVLLKDPNKPMLRLYAVSMSPLSLEFVVGSQDPYADLVPTVEEELVGSDGDE